MKYEIVAHDKFGLDYRTNKPYLSRLFGLKQEPAGIFSKIFLKYWNKLDFSKNRLLFELLLP